MRVRKTIHYIAVVLWLISASYLLYQYSLNAGYWDLPLYISLVLFLIIIISQKPFTKLNLWIFFFYIAFGIWISVDIFLMMTDVFSVE